jgi:hypothetical protein
MTVDRERTWLALRAQTLQPAHHHLQTGTVVVKVVAAHDMILVVESRLTHEDATS